jgi:hypothetical protein
MIHRTLIIEFFMIEPFVIYSLHGTTWYNLNNIDRLIVTILNTNAGLLAALLQAVPFSPLVSGHTHSSSRPQRCSRPPLLSRLRHSQYPAYHHRLLPHQQTDHLRIANHLQLSVPRRDHHLAGIVRLYQPVHLGTHQSSGH